MFSSPTVKQDPAFREIRQLLTPSFRFTVNSVRAIRLAEIMGDFRNLQHYIARIQAQPSPEEYYLEGYVLLRQCAEEARQVLAYPYAPSAEAPKGDTESEKEQLQRLVQTASGF